MEIIRGQKVKLTDILPSQQFFISVNVQSPFVTDVALFGLDKQQKLSNEAYMIFYNQPKSPCNALQLQKQEQAFSQFLVDLNQLPNTIQKMVLTLTVDGTDTMANLGNSRVEILNENQQMIATFLLNGNMFDKERAVMALEVYQKDGIWRLSAVGQGFNGGLPALIEYFGGEVAESESTPKPSTAPQSTVNLSKVTLTKKDEQHRISLSKKDSSFIVEAIWVDNGDDRADNDDLDLRVGILVEGQNQMHYVHAPQQSGSLTNFPFVHHLGDVRQASVNEPGTEKVEVNTNIAKLIGGRVALVFSVYSAVSNGVVSIASLQPKMRMQYENQVIECVFNAKVSPQAQRDDVYTYVIGLAIIDENGIVLQHSGLTSKPSSEATPRLVWEKGQPTIYMDGQPIFKTEVDDSLDKKSSGSLTGMFKDIFK
ncbi:tellurium resistance protein (TerF) [Moraxella macacae 0408225]|uniref:Tellurium resistance protein (TerF) n=1 Tax=Moraxella macacae 0408225 TaxID=1230338 RepID=L2FA10_9GAMM|nr:TerD family protein [Moraxella macacae]ELA09308.1 tellurium resistance protein (TerF) [Moraxella macacae 0408225]